VITILDLPELLAIVEEAIDAVPSWEREALRERLEAAKARAQKARADG
jgi:hypothetical protein